MSLAAKATYSSALCHRFVSSLQFHTALASSSSASSLPELPKKPQSSFLRYLASTRDKLKASNPGAPVTQITKLAGEKWKLLPEEEKQIYKDAHLKDATAWSAKKASIEEHLAKANLLGEVKAKRAEERVEKALKKAKGDKKKLSEDLGKPKQPPQAFSLFIKDHLSKNPAPAGVKVTERFKKAVEDWKQLDESGKAKYVEAHTQLREKYNADLKVWNEKVGETEEVKKADAKLSKLRTRKREIAAAGKE